MSAPIGFGLLLSLLLSPPDPQGVRDLGLQPGQTWRAAAPIAAEIVCDDPAIVLTRHRSSSDTVSGSS